MVELSFMDSGIVLQGNYDLFFIEDRSRSLEKKDERFFMTVSVGQKDHTCP